MEEQEAKPAKHQPERSWKRKVSQATQMRYFMARVRLGFSPNAPGRIAWAELHTKTTFIWKFETLEETAAWMIRACYRDYWKLPSADRLQIALHYCHRAFGVAASDITGDQRNPVLVIPRHIVMVCMRRSGLARYHVAMRFKRDHTTILHAENNVGKLFEGIPYEPIRDEAARDLGPSFNREASGPVPS